jgi:hypothetical protein
MRLADQRPMSPISLERLVEKHECLATLVEEWRVADQRALTLQARVYEVQLEALTKGVAELRRLVYIGVGIALVLNVAILVLKR